MDMEIPGEPGIIVIDRQCDEKGMRVNNFDKTLIAIIIGIVFFILAHPFIFNVSNRGAKVIGLRTTTSAGVPTMLGLILHTIIFILIIRFLMH
jgi:hypothetical protein